MSKTSFSGPLLACVLIACGSDGDGSSSSALDSGTGNDGGRELDGGRGATDASQETNEGDSAVDAGAERDSSADDVDAGACPDGVSGSAPADYLAQFKSGTRLTARYFAHEGMPNVFAGFYDTELEVACDFMMASDDKLRCLPRAARGVQLGFVDSDCQRVAYHTECGPEPGYVRRRRACDGAYDVLELGPLVAATPLFYDYGEIEGCKQSEQTATPSENAFAAGEVVAADRFVEGSVRTLSGVCRGSLRLIEGTDGSLGPYEVIDVASSAACEHRPGTAGCWPVRRAFEDPTLYSDMMCTEKTALATWLNPVACGLPDFIRPITAEPYLYQVGPLHEGAVYSTTGDACEPAEQKPWIGPLFELGEAVSEDQLVELTTRALGSERLRPYVVHEGATALMAQHAGLEPTFHDSVRGEDCVPKLFTDDTWRCVVDRVHSFEGGTLFNDAACTEPLFVCGGDPSCVEGALLVQQEYDAFACGTQARVEKVFALGAHATGYFVHDGLDCNDMGTPDSDLWQVENVPFDTLEALQLFSQE